MFLVLLLLFSFLDEFDFSEIIENSLFSGSIANYLESAGL